MNLRWEIIMAKKNHAPGSVPPANQPQSGPPEMKGADDQAQETASQSGGDQEQDPKHRLGDYVGKGEHSIQQPGGKNDANHHSGRKKDK